MEFDISDIHPRYKIFAVIGIHRTDGRHAVWCFREKSDAEAFAGSLENEEKSNYNFAEIQETVVWGRWGTATLNMPFNEIKLEKERE